MGFGEEKNTLMGAFDTSDKTKRLKIKKVKKARIKFGEQKVFGLTGKLVKRSKGFR